MLFKPVYNYNNLNIKKNISHLSLKFIELGRGFYKYDEIDWFNLNENPNAIDILKENIDKIKWYELSSNPNAIDLLRNNIDKIDWDLLSANPSAIDLLKENPDKIIWHMLSKNPAPAAIDLLRDNLDKIDWYGLSKNPAAIDLLRVNLDKINWEILSSNRAAMHILFPYDYEKMRHNMYCFLEELVEKVFNPKRLERLGKIYNLSLEELQDYY